ncbi:hypothetical protein CFAM422_001105 [Trichoderma lentiforme]|uniref:Uncharacterized protein n=1 Tax=Trichoderma lentiforme TaxID=1567552 RepID=A0A9P5CIQ3_9HYPO|nr:hypothetical protein CFAM422_001105 [Trichoderma lentiforme]
MAYKGHVYCLPLDAQKEFSLEDTNGLIAIKAICLEKYRMQKIKDGESLVSGKVLATSEYERALILGDEEGDERFNVGGNPTKSCGICAR